MAVAGKTRKRKKKKERDYFTVTEVCNLEGVSRITAYDWINKGKIEAEKDEWGRWRIPKDSYDRPDSPQLN